MKKHIIVGTAGHVDHGKSSIVKILTGIDPDRLIEEQKRGITIDLGFAYLDLDNISFSFVDVPGHENYLKNMVAGAIGFDICICAVDINEGIMPQTLEHMNIVKFLGVDFVIVAITKIDNCQEGLEEKIYNIKKFFQKYNFRHNSFINWSIFDDTSKNLLLKNLLDYAKVFQRKSLWDIFWLHIDRVFSLKGFGTVVTGSVISGDLNVGSTVNILPCHIQSKIKGLSIHNQKVNNVKAGCRVAINLHGVEKDDIHRGYLITDCIDIDNYIVIYGVIDIFDTGFDIKLKHGGEYFILVGTTLRHGKIYFITEKFVKVVFTEKYPFMPKMKMLIRLPNPKITVAGITILFVDDLKMKKGDLLQFLEIMTETGTNVEGLKYYLEKFHSMNKKELYQKFLVKFSSLSDEFVEIEDYIFLKSYVDKILNDLKFRLEAEKKMSFDSLLMIDDKVLRGYLTNWIIEYAKRNNYVIRDGEIRSDFNDQFEKITEMIFDAMNKELSLSNVSVISESLNIDKEIVKNCIKFLSNKGLIKRIDKTGNYIPVEILKKFIYDAAELCRKEGYIDIQNARKIIDAPRKILIPLLEILDVCGFVNRDNKRYLRGKLKN
jgi:selenocysteine-specific elongation factor